MQEAVGDLDEALAMLLLMVYEPATMVRLLDVFSCTVCNAAQWSVEEGSGKGK